MLRPFRRALRLPSVAAAHTLTGGMIHPPRGPTAELDVEERMRRFLFVLIVAFASASQALHAAFDCEKYQLPNGMTVILHEDHALPIAVINTWYYVGSKDEPERRTGFAHLFEHLMFMGTRRVPDNAFDVIMESAGGHNNASTSEDRTNYYSLGPSELLSTLLWLDADRLEDLGREMNREKLDKQRDVVRNERRQTGENTPYGRAMLRIPELMFPKGHPYHHPVIGSHEDLEAATVDDVKNFFATYYVPSNASLVVAGDFNPREIKPLIEKLFGTLPRGNDVIHRHADPIRLSGVQRCTMTDQVQFAKTFMVYHSSAALADGDAEMDLVAALLSDGVSSRLYQKLIYQSPLAVDVAAYQASMKLQSLFFIEATARQGVSLDDLENAIDEALRELVTTGPAEDELNRRKAGVEYAKVARWQSLLARADQMNEYQAFWGQPDSFDRDLNRYRAVTPAAVRHWAEKVFSPDARLILRVLPETRLDPADRDERPALAAAADFKPPLPESFRLVNGIPVHHWPRRGLPLFHALLLIDDGAALDGPQSGRAALTADMLDEGAADRDAVQFADALDAIGARFSADADYNGSTLAVSALARHADAAVELFADAARRPRFDDKEWTRVHALHVEGLKQRLDEPAVVASWVGLRAFFGDEHPYGKPVVGTPAAAETITLDDVRRFHRASFRPSRATFLTAGDLSADRVRSLLEQSFGDWKEPAEPAPDLSRNLPAPDPRALRVVLVDRPDAVQTVIRFYMPAGTYADPRRIPLQLFNVILGGSFTSRLNQNLRERNGFTYGARSGFVMDPLAGYFSASSSVFADVTGPALREFLAEFRAIRSGDIHPDEAEKARATFRSDVVESMEGLSGLLNAAARLVRNGRSFADLAADLRSAAKLGESDLNRLASDALPLERAVLVLVGDKKRILEQIEGLDLPKPEEWTPTGEKK